MSAAPESLFGYLAARFVSQRENLATEALAWVLRGSSAAEQGLRELFSELVESNFDEPLVWSTQDGGPSGIPDLTGREGTHRRVLVEAKFDAALTTNQPVGYLGLLTENDLLAFLVPSKRVAVLWPEVCRLAGAQPIPALNHPVVRLPTGVALAMFTWRQVMDALLGATTGDPNAHVSLLQLDGLIHKVEAEVFQPLTDEDLTGSSARRIVDCGRIVQALAERLQESVAGGAAIADKTGLRTGSGPSWWGHYLRLNGWVCFLHWSADRWNNVASTPFWLIVKDESEATSPAVRKALAPLTSSFPPKAFDNGSDVAVALRPPLEADFDQVLDGLVEQVRAVANLIPAP